MSDYLADYYNNPDLQEQARQTLAYVRLFLEEHDIAPTDSVVDLGCGIGALAVGLAEAGWSSVTGVDYAPQMLDIARELAESRGVAMDFTAASITDWVPQTPAQVMICFDVLNHVLEPGEVQALLTHVLAQLAPGGYFLFDVNTLKNFESPIWNYENRELTSETYRMCLNGWFDAGTGRVYARSQVTMETAQGPQTTDNTLMCQYHAEPDLMDWLTQVGFQDIRTFGYSPLDLSQIIPGLEFTKTRFECRKPG